MLTKRVFAHFTRPACSRKGFTLLEIIMVIVLLGIVSVVTGALLFQGTRAFQVMDVRGDLKSSGTAAIERMTKEMRQIRCTSAGSTCTAQSNDITNMTAGELRFVNSNNEGRGFRVSSGNLLLRLGSTAGDPEYTLSGNAASITFDYLKKDGTAASVSTDIWTINVTLSLANGQETINLMASVHPRNFL